MGKVVERTRKKKKGRPSLLDLQKRSLKEQQERRNPNPAPQTSKLTRKPHRRTTRRNSNPDVISPESDENTREDDEELNGKRREKKLKLVLKLPSQRSSSVNSGSNVSDSDDAFTVGTLQNKQKINAIGDGSIHGDTEKAENHVSAPDFRNIPQGTQLDKGPPTPLPDKKLLLFILDRLQKKDTYGVFAEPVDPEELPDYHEVIEHPMDFGTVKKNVATGAYANLEQFEKGVFLICSNAMRYNASDTIYFRQARSILELAKKDFENLRRDTNDIEPERKIVRRGRPPTKNLKNQMGRPPLECAGSEFSSDATLATGTETWWNYDLRKGPFPDKSGPADFPGRPLYGSHNSEAYSCWSAEQKSKTNDEFTGSMSKGNWMKHCKKQVAFDESKHNTYKHFHLSSDAQEPSVLTTFDGERKQLIAVGLHTEYGYVRSLARFAANLGPSIWKVASKKIEKSMPAGVKFGPGWVTENEGAPLKSLIFPSPPTVQTSSSWAFFPPRNSYGAATPSIVEIKGEKPSDDPEGHKLSQKLMASAHSALDGQLGKPLCSSAPVSSPIVGNRFPELAAESASAVREMNSHANVRMMSRSVGSMIRPGPAFQIHQNPVIHPRMNDFDGGPTGSNLQSSQMVDIISRNDTNFAHQASANCCNSEDSKLLENTSKINSSSILPDSGREGFTGPRTGLQPQPYWQQGSLQQKPDPAPPDLNVRFHSPGSPTLSRVNSTQPDLALQL